MRALFKERLFKKHYNRLLETRKGKTTKPSINTVSSLTILVAAKNHSVADIIDAPKYFRDMGITCHVYVVKEPTENLDITPGLRFIDTKDCEWYGVPSQEMIVDWLVNKTDLLIMSNPGNDPLLKYLCAASNSKLKSTLVDSTQQNEDLDIDLWIDIKNPGQVTLKKQCILTYSTLTKIGIKPPVIG